MEKDKKLSHVDEHNQPTMVDVGAKSVSQRYAHARCLVHLGSEITALLDGEEIYTKKGAVFQTAIIAGTMGAKKTSELIPFCHPIGLEDCKIKIQLNQQQEAQIDCFVSVQAKTGVEMEALTGATVAALTIYDMCKALSHDITIREAQLMEKTGGKKDFKR